MAEAIDRFRRKRLMCDKVVQGTLLVRAGLYGVALMSYMAAILFFTQWLSNQSLALSSHLTLFFTDVLYWAPGLLVLFPLLGFDLIRETNRFAGPLFRLRTQMERMVRGEDGEVMKLREGDSFQELAASFNRLREEVLQLRSLQSNDVRYRDVQQPEWLASQDEPETSLVSRES